MASFLFGGNRRSPGRGSFASVSQGSRSEYATSVNSFDFGAFDDEVEDMSSGGSPLRVGDPFDLPTSEAPSSTSYASMQSHVSNNGDLNQDTLSAGTGASSSNTIDSLGTAHFSSLGVAHASVDPLSSSLHPPLPHISRSFAPGEISMPTQAGAAGAAGAGSRPTSLPGAYDFEPQGNEGGPSPPVLPLHSRPSASSPSSHSFFARARQYVRSNGTRRSDEDGEADEVNEGRGLLFSHDESVDDDDNTQVEPSNVVPTSTYPPASSTDLPASHLPLPARPWVSLPSSTLSGVRVFGGGQGNDGVFANLSAKPDGHRRVGGEEWVGGDDYGGDKEEVLPAYEIAALDTTPPYWETTVITPQGFLGPDDICVDGLPVGNLFGFAWNLLVSMSFQFVGFLLTYLLHTTHAAKNGSRAGLGITLIQLGFYLKQRVDHPELILANDGLGMDPGNTSSDIESSDVDVGSAWAWWTGIEPPSGDQVAAVATATRSALGSLPTQVHSALSGMLDVSDPDSPIRQGGQGAGGREVPSLGNVDGGFGYSASSAEVNQWMAFMLVTVGSFLLIGGCLSYWRAVRFARAVRQGMGQGDPENRIE